MIPTPRLIALLFVPVALFLAALAVRELQGLALAVDCGLLALVALDALATRRAAGFRVSLRAPQVASVTDEDTLHVVVENDGGLRTRAELRVVLPPELVVARQVEPLALAPRSACEVAVRFTPQKRGRYVVGPVYLRYRSALRLLSRTLRFNETREVRVLPAVASIKKYQILARRLRTADLGFRTRPIRGQGMEFSRLRDYHHDDDIRRVDWKATARRGRLISREYQVERSQTLVLMIDAGRMLTEEVDGVAKMEHALTAALLLTRIAADYDDRVGAIVFGERVLRALPSRKGRAAVSALTQGLFDVQPSLIEPDYEAAFEHLNLHFRKRCLVVLLTNIVDPSASNILRGCLAATARRHLPLCVALGDLEVQEWSERTAAGEAGKPPDEASIYKAASACHLLSMRAAAMRDLQRSGVHVVDCPAASVAPRVVDAYLSLKARQLI